MAMTLGIPKANLGCNAAGATLRHPRSVPCSLSRSPRRRHGENALSSDVAVAGRRTSESAERHYHAREVVGQRLDCLSSQRIAEHFGACGVGRAVRQTKLPAHSVGGIFTSDFAQLERRPHHQAGPAGVSLPRSCATGKFVHDARELQLCRRMH